jgi:peptidoglycan L-alanyl-D-glutamate endopeptidase CwlK
MSHGLPDPPDEPGAIRALDCLAPKFKVRVAAMLADMETRGFDPIVIESCRSDARQAWLYGMGREWDDGRGIVTNAPTGIHSWHRFGLAVDVISERDEWNAPARFWNALGSAALRHQLSWGGLWLRFADKPHVQHGAPMRQSPSSRAVQLEAEGGLLAVWKEVQAA